MSPTLDRRRARPGWAQPAVEDELLELDPVDDEDPDESDELDEDPDESAELLLDDELVPDPSFEPLLARESVR